MKKSEKGVTLIALIITVIVLIVLAVVAVRGISGNDGIANRARASRYNQEMASVLEKCETIIADYQNNSEDLEIDIIQNFLKRGIIKQTAYDNTEYILDTSKLGIEDFETTVKGTYIVKVENYKIVLIYSQSGKEKVTVGDLGNVSTEDLILYLFTIDENGVLTAKESYYYTGIEFPITNLVIPETYNGITVKKIGDDFLAGAYLKRVTLPNTVEEIGNRAFYQSSLNEINLPNGLKKIGDHALCSGNLGEIFIPSSVTTIGFYAVPASDIYCEVSSKPAGWDADWSGGYYYQHIYWGATGIQK